MCSSIYAPILRADVLSFLSVCSSFRKLADSRYLWITILRRTQTRRNLACPVGTNVSQIDIDKLRRIARLTHRVERNWSQARPRVARAVKSVPYLSFSQTNIVEPAAILAVIPATSLVILYTHEHAQQIILCDSNGEIPLSSVHVGKITRRAHFDEAGRHLIAVATELEESLRVFSVQYGIGESPSIKQIFYKPHFSLAIRALFLCNNVVGIIPHDDDDIPNPHIYAIDFAKDQSITISMTPHGRSIEDTLDVFCSVVHEVPFIVTSSLNVYRVYRCSKDIFTCCDVSGWEDGASIVDEGSVVLVAEIPVPEDDDPYDVETPELEWSPLGLHALHILYYNSHRGFSNAVTRALLWPLDKHPHTPLAGVNHASLVMGRIHGSVASYPESHSSPWLVSSSPSGIYSVIVVDQVNGDVHVDFKSLHLLQYDSETPTIYHRPLDLPSYINLHQIYAVAIDERCGMVYLSHAQGHLFAVPYA